ncbi:MAG: caspase family protein [Raineya sp.]|jgi:hypothetical protein|nr:caspase family protein [Raineya sp.]
MDYLISIGINKVSGLNPLNSAVKGAEEFAEWGKSQNYHVSLFTDVEKKVCLSEIFDGISKIIDAKNCEKLIIFFSGHGILKSPSQEIWLLSDAKINPNESINLTTSIDYANTCGIPYIVFISDACRILPNELQLTGNGGVIFPICPANQSCAIDILYATRAGHPAMEQNSINNSKKFGLFTKAIIDVLKGYYPEIIESQNMKNLSTYYNLNDLNTNPNYKNLSDGIWYINTINSEDSIKSIVEQSANEISISLTQSPEIVIRYQKPKPNLAEFTDTQAKNLLLSGKNQVTNRIPDDSILMKNTQNYLEDGIFFINNDITSFNKVLKDLQLIPKSLKSKKSNLIKNGEKIFASKDIVEKLKEEIGTGLIIIGTKIKDIILNGLDHVYIKDNDFGQTINIYPDERLQYSGSTFRRSKLNSNTGLIILDNGQSIPIAILDRYIGTLIFQKNYLLTINYTPVDQDHYFAFSERENDINFIRAFIASAANEGFDYSKTFKHVFNQRGDINDDLDIGLILRRFESLDPSLGLYAAYAYRQVGKFKDIQSIYSYLRLDDDIIFDIAMLADKLDSTSQNCIPFCPMMSLGWAYRKRFESFIPKTIQKASEFLIPSLWTTFDRNGTKLLETFFTRNKII